MSQFVITGDNRRQMKKELSELKSMLNRHYFRGINNPKEKDMWEEKKKRAEYLETELNQIVINN